MSLTVAFGALLCGVIVWLLLVRTLTGRPWEATSASEAPLGSTESTPPARTGLWVFLAVVTSLFALFLSAYYMRMGHGHGLVHDWHPVREPPVLWFNSAVLLLASVAMQWARGAVNRGKMSRTRDALLVAGLLTFAFLAGQLYAWTQLTGGQSLELRDPAMAFFYVLTALHGLHLLGGLIVWSRTLWRTRTSAAEAIDVRLSVELCTTYWHFMLLVWVVLFAMLLST